MAKLYRAEHKTQKNPNDPYGNYSCMAYAAAMAVEFATLGGVQIGGKGLRGLTNEAVPDPGSEGLTIRQIIEAAGDLHVDLFDRTGKPWSGVMAALQDNRGIVLIGDRDQFKAVPCSSSFRGSHAVYIQLKKPEQGIRVSDPLCSGSHEVSPAILRDYAEKRGNQQGLSGGGVMFAVTRSIPLIQ